MRKTKGKMDWFDIKNKSNVSEIWLYDEIGMWGKTAKDFISELKEIKNKQIDLHINSPGGSVFEGNAIYNALKNHDAEITTYIDGIAASIASIIALAGKKVIIAENAMYMVHNPSGLTMGEAKDMRKSADVLDKIRDTMVGIYVNKSKKSEDDVKKLLDDETWYNADEAKENNFVDEIVEKMDMAACAKFIPVMKHYGFKYIPKIENIAPLSDNDKNKIIPLNNNVFIGEEDAVLRMIYKI